ncbi:MAG: O-antigen ligase family protein [Phycisphaerales bacterium]|nr:O-antigen ligase family protein [Phycisphaerales bacterium]
MSPLSGASVPGRLPGGGGSPTLAVGDGARAQLGLHIHCALAALFVALIPVVPAPRDIAFAALTAFAVLRLPRTMPTYRALVRQPIVWFLLAWPAWQAVSLLWSPDVAEGIRELKAMRAVLVPFILWPVCGRGRYLVAAFLVGVVLLNGAQALSGAGLLITEHTELHPGRFGGLLNPIQAGISCAIGLCWAIAAVLVTRGGKRAMASVALVSAAAGLFFSGSRGPWVGAVAGIAVLLAVLAVRHPALRRRVTTLAILAALAGIVALATPRFQDRYAESVTESSDSWAHVDVTTSIGLRLWLWQAAWQEFRARPIAGTGAGGFVSAVKETQAYRADMLVLPEKERIVIAHPHSVYLHMLAVHGIVGGVILAGLLILALRQASRDREDPIYAAGALAALVAWTVGAGFDCYNRSGQTTYELALLVTLTLAGRTHSATAEEPAPPGPASTSTEKS